MLGHIGLAPQDFFGPDPTDLERLMRGGLKVLFNGPAAVIVFFVLSGFVIHFPQAQGKVLNVASFYTRRFIRIGVPASAAAIVYLFVGVDISYPLFGVLWSIICEGIYYALYPFLRAAAEKYRWDRLALATFALALLVALANLETLALGNNMYAALGLWTWVVGLPCWIMGCWLAENWSRFPELGRTKIWMVRLSVYALSVLLRAVKSQVEPPYGSDAITLNFFAFLVVIWLGLEVKYFMKRVPLPALEKAGAWSYSLYLIHPVSDTLFTGVFNTLLGHSLVIVGALLSSYVFYLVVEQPSHRLAVRGGKTVQTFTGIAQPRV